MLHGRRVLVGHRLFLVRIRNPVGERRADTLQGRRDEIRPVRTEIDFAWIVGPVAVRVGPLVQSCRRDIPVCLLDDVDVPHIREPSPSPFDNRLAVASHVVRGVEPRHGDIPDLELDTVETGRRRHDIGRRVGRDATLLGSEGIVVGVANAQIQRQPPCDGPRVLHLQIGVVQEIDGRHRVVVRRDLEWCAVPELQLIIARRSA